MQKDNQDLRTPNPGAASRGLPSFCWRAGQDRRFEMVRTSADLAGATGLDLGCGLGMYTEKFNAEGANFIGLEVDWPRAIEARERGLDITAAVGEALPFEDGRFDLVFLNEVLEHVRDDHATAAEIVRVLKPGGRALIFVPNRLWPFETHGIYWRGEYRFGNKPFVNYLPDGLRNRLAPHVRVYTNSSLRACFEDLPVRIHSHIQIFPGYDKLGARRPALGRLVKRVSYALERSPLRRFGLSHWLVVERLPATANDPNGPMP